MVCTERGRLKTEDLRPAQVFLQLYVMNNSALQIFFFVSSTEIFFHGLMDQMVTLDAV